MTTPQQSLFLGSRQGVNMQIGRFQYFSVRIRFLQFKKFETSNNSIAFESFVHFDNFLSFGKYWQFRVKFRSIAKFVQFEYIVNFVACAIWQSS